MFWVLLPLTLSSVYAQPKLSSYEGLHFFVGFMENESTVAMPDKHIEQYIFITSEYETTVKVKYGQQAAFNVFIPLNEVVNILAPRSMENFNSEVVSKNLIEITAEVPITVYAFSSMKHSSESYSVIPVSNWGTEYVALTLPNDHYNKPTLDSIRDYTPRSSQFMIMAAYDNTLVTYYPKSMTRKLNQIDSAYTVLLNKGECYLVQSWQYMRGQGDLSGSFIKADKPIGVLTGHVRTALAQGFTEQPPDSKDHLIEMLMPVASWGRTFISVPFGTNPNKGDYFKLTTRTKEAKVDIYTSTGPLELKFPPNSNVQELAGLNKPALWVASAPIQLGQFMYRVGDSLETLNYDPSMVILPPVEQYISSIKFLTPGEIFLPVDAVKYSNHFVTLVAQNISLESLTLNNKFVENISDIRNQVIPGTDMHWARIEIEPGQHKITCDTGRFSGIIFGIGRFDSYSMVLGSSLRNPYSDDNIFPTLSVTEDCYEVKGTITDEISEKSFGIYYSIVNQNLTTNFSWKIDPIVSDAKVITFSAKPIDIFKDGKFVIDFYDKSGNRGTYTKIHNAVKISHPELIVLNDIGWIDSTCFEHVVTNDGLSPIVINSATLSADSRVKLFTDPALPYEIPPGGSVKFNICVNPKGESDAILGKIDLEFECDIDVTYNFRGEVLALEIIATGHDFGDVLLGDLPCDSVSITNTSNTPVTITELNSAFNLPQFIVDTAGRLPILLNPGETVKFQVCFIPTLNAAYEDSIIFRNEYDYYVYGIVKGRGVSPKFDSYVIDWGNRRIGTTNDTTIYIKNTGTSDGVIKFSQFNYNDFNDDNSATLSQLNDVVVPAQDSIEVSFSYLPIQGADYLLEAEYRADWTLHEPFTIRLIGVPTIPEIETADYDFGDVELYSTKSANFAAVFAGGNEILTIDSIYVISGDAASFNFNLDGYKDFTLDPNNNLMFDIEFAPMRLGSHEIIFGVVHDANPNYARSVKEFKVTANSIAPKTENLLVEIVTNPTFVCLLHLGEVTITNKGEVRADITGLTIETDNPAIMARITDFEPKSLEPNETVKYGFEYYLERNVTGTITINIELFGEYEIVQSYELQLPAADVTINQNEDVVYSVDDTVTFKFSGTFHSDADTLVSFKFILDLRKDYFFILDEEIFINIEKNGIMNKYSLYKSIFFDKLELNFSERLIKVSENSTWSFEIRALGLLPPEKEKIWTIKVNSDECFEPDEKNIKTKLNDLCIFDLRHVQFLANFQDVNIYPNPVHDEMKLKILTDKKMDDISINISDLFGNTKSLGTLPALDKGLHEQIFSIGNLQSGSYMLHFRSDSFEKNIMFVIIK
ncbi:MAG: hypothetical protein CVV22_03545 [Ignavibacteriae bacterium HGW-Ignavibacteriae-1]|nr:MAG: hypothetical protein CVV22_03545 [Ignavibacteriae bacterium HGW-Ignavibacteriae-1]